jgi:hypothetical protein
MSSNSRSGGCHPVIPVDPDSVEEEADPAAIELAPQPGRVDPEAPRAADATPVHQATARQPHTCNSAAAMASTGSADHGATPVDCDRCWANPQHRERLDMCFQCSGSPAT